MGLKRSPKCGYDGIYIYIYIEREREREDIYFFFGEYQLYFIECVENISNFTSA